MRSDYRHIWPAWLETLHRWGLENFAAWLLEALGPVNLVGAQLVYLGQPVAEAFFSNEDLQALAHLLEHPQEAQAFVRFLREAETA